jgi:uncharacterized membrane protein YdbT with pleckstrin-like domain
MKNHWFRLQKDQIALQTQPYFLWYLLEIIKFVILRIISSFFLLVSLLAILEQNWIFEEFTTLISQYNIWFLFGWVFGCVLVVFFFTYCDYKLRKYTLFNDCVEYFEWFFNKTTSIIPMEKITSVEKNQSFISKIFWIYNVIISSEWFGNRVVFANIINGNKLSILIHEIKKNDCFKRKIWIFSYEQNLDFVQSYHVNHYKTYINNLWSIFILPLYVYLFLKSKSFIYKITSHSVELEYNFINAYNKIFHLDTITRITFHRSFLDKILWTCSIKFYSLGDYQPIVFNNIFYFDNLEKDIVSKIGIQIDQLWHDLPIDRSNKSIFYRYFYFSVPFALLVWVYCILLFFSLFTFTFFQFLSTVIWLGVIYAIFFAFYKLYIFSFVKRFYFHTVYDNFILSTRWFLFQKKDYFIFDHIKSLSLLIYPRMGTWTLSFELSWWLMYESERYKFLKLKYHNKIKIPYVKSLENVFHVLENKLHKEPIWNQILDISSPWFVPYLVLYIVFVVSFVYLTPWSNYVLFFLLFVWWVLFYIRYKTHFILEKNRFIKKSGIIYKKKKSVLFKKLDYIHCYRNVLNFLTKNANIVIFTKWSWFPDLKFSFIERYWVFYNNSKKME